MFELLFGIIWTLICMPFMFIMLSGSENINFLACLMIWAFFGIGIAFIIAGIRKILRNINTDKNGEECFGKVIEVEDTGAKVNGNKIYKAFVALYINSENRVAIISEEVGFNPLKYRIGEYVLVKYYQNDINFVKNIYENEIPESIRTELDDQSNTNINKHPEMANFKEDYYEDMKKPVSPEVAVKTRKVVGVICIFFALQCLFFVAMFLLPTLLPSGENTTYTLNGEQVTKEEFEKATLPDNIIAGVFGIFFVAMLVFGIKQCFTKISKDDKNLEEKQKYNYENLGSFNSSNDTDDPIKNR